MVTTDTEQDSCLVDCAVIKWTALQRGVASVRDGLSVPDGTLVMEGGQRVAAERGGL